MFKIMSLFFSCWITVGVGMAEAASLWKMDFESYKQSQMPSGFETSGPGWSIIREKTAPSKENSYFARMGEGAGVYSTAIFREAGELGAIATQVRIRIDKSGKDQSAGLVIKQKNGSDFLCVIISAAAVKGSVNLFRVNGKGAVVLASVNAKITAGIWQRLQVFTKDNRMSCSIDNQKIFDFENDVLSAGGRVGLITFGDSSAGFDNFTVSKIDK